MRNVFTRAKEWVWDSLFLDFYLDRHWTFRFKLLNFLSGDTLRYYVVGAWREWTYAAAKAGASDDPEIIDFWKNYGTRQMRHCIEELVAQWERDEQEVLR